MPEVFDSAFIKITGYDREELSKVHEAELSQVANYDALTGIPNRRLPADRMSANQCVLDMINVYRGDVHP